LFGDEAAVILRVAEASTGVASEASVSSDEDVKRRQLFAHAAALGTAAAVERLTPSPGSPMGREDTLVGRQAATGETEREIIAAIRRALLGSAPLVVSGIASGELDVNALRRRVNGAWQLRQRARYVELGRLLPGLLTDAQLASRELGGDDQAHALTVTAHAYNTTSSVLRRLGDTSSR
jgi:hypothetical protein